MIYRVSKQNVINSINYFKTLQVDKDDGLFLFLMAKSLGITTTYPVTFKVGNLSEEQKEKYLNLIWMLGGIFDSSEIADKGGIIFPNGFGRVSLYQPGTSYKDLIGRVKDTVEKKNINIPIYNNDDSNLTLTHNYKEVIEDNYLHGNKISLAQTAAWFFRFTEFNYDNILDSKSFSKVLEKLIKKFFRLNKKDFLWLFEDDLSFNRISPNDSGISGEEIRHEFDFSKNPDISKIQDNIIFQSSSISKDDVTRYIELSGDNPSNKIILDTLLAKKQVVLTGVPGVGKSRYTTYLRDSGEFSDSEMIQFHANYSYEDFIGSETLISENGGTKVVTRKGVFLTFIEKAKENPSKKYLFIIDELNRGNFAEIFGETILTLDRGYSANLSKNFDGVNNLSIPENMYIICTMNTSDRNIAFLDLAIRRRFAFIRLSPNYDFLSESVKLENYDVGNILRVINRRISETLKDSELHLGQSYFIPSEKDGDFIWDFDNFKNQFNYVLLPTLEEYSFNDENALHTIVGERLADGIQDTDEFYEAFSSEFGV